MLICLSIVALSGLGGHAFGSFKERGGTYMWLRDSLPYDLTRQDTGRPMARVTTYGYESAVAGSKNIQNLEDLATSFHHSLSALVSGPIVKPIVLVAHSLGGLIVKQVSIAGYYPGTGMLMQRVGNNHAVEIKTRGRSATHPSNLWNCFLWCPARRHGHQLSTPHGRGRPKPFPDRVYQSH